MPEDIMPTHIKTKSVTFARPFALGGLSSRQPPGTYEVETTVHLDHRGRAFMRTATFIDLKKGIAKVQVRVDPADLQDALEKDSRGAAAIF